MLQRAAHRPSLPILVIWIQLQCADTESENQSTVQAPFFLSLNPKDVWC